MNQINSNVQAALNALKIAAMELSNVIDNSGYELKAAPKYLQDADDFAYEIQTFVEDELELINKVEQ